MQDQQTGLRRALGFWALVAYGVGDILGAGIYALVGKIAGLAGSASWLAFLIALSVAALTALSYAELSSRIPRAGGESNYCQTAFNSPAMGLLIGWLVFCSGVVSMATVSRAFAGYFLNLFPTAPAAAEVAVVVGFLLVLSAINFWGIRQSSLTNVICTVVEISGLLLVIAVGVSFIWGDRGAAAGVGVVDHRMQEWPAGFAIMQAAALAFFAFIGFEDMVNVAEETRAPRATLPAAIVTALLVAGSIYIVVVWVATQVVPPAELGASRAPLLEVVRRAAPAIPPWSFTLIAFFAVANTGLLNGIMGSRLLYGMAQQRLLPAAIARIHPLTQTPHWAILVVLAAAAALALSGTLVILAGTTSVILLMVFCLVNLSLVKIKLRSETPFDGFRAPLFVPISGCVASLVLVYALPTRARLTAGVIVALGLLLVAVWKRTQARGRPSADRGT